MRHACLAFCFLFLQAFAEELSWSNLRFPDQVSPENLATYLQSVRHLTNPRIAPGKTHPASWRPPPVELSSLSRAKGALSKITADHIEILLRECSAAEREASRSSIEVWRRTPEGRDELAGFDPIGVRFRTAFTQVALAYIIQLPQVPADRRKIVFDSLGRFPELIAAVSPRGWLRELDDHVSVALIKRIDSGIGWRGSAPHWIANLIALDTKRSWLALAYMMTDCEVDVQVATYWAVKQCPAPKLNFERTVERAWNVYKLDVGRYRPIVYAPIAAENGHADALLVLAECIRDGTPPNALAQSSEALLQLIETPFAEAGRAAEFVIKNQSRFSFNQTKRQFVLRP